MADVFREVDEALREDRAKTLAKRYGPIGIAVVVLIVAGVGGWTFWQDRTKSQAEQRTAALTEAVAQMDQSPASAQAALEAVAADGADGQAMLARFYQAQIMIDEGNIQAAAEIYDQLSGDASVGQIWRDLAGLRAAILLVGTDEPAEVRARLSAFTAVESPWRFTANEMMALLALREGNQEEAIGILENLRDDGAAPGSLRERAGRLIDSLGQ
ncbi:MAG: tetratricopeptide repeat protein [Pseudomonadota bacterium]